MGILFKQKSTEEDIIEVSINSNKMQAFLKIQNTLLYDITFEEVKKKMEEAGVVYGVDESKIRYIIDNNVCDSKELIAEGDTPTHGEDTKHIYHFEVHSKKEPKILEDGSVDYYGADVELNVEEGHVLVTAIPFTKGMDGWAVTGEPIEAKPGRHINFPKGKNVVVDKEKNALVSSCAGKVLFQDGRVNVINIISYTGDIGGEYGDVDFNGDVEILGNVLAGRMVKATGTITISGSVEAAQIKAGRDIVLVRGIQGDKRGVLEAEGDITAKFIESATVFVKGDLKVGALMNSEVLCEKNIIVSGKKGQIIGGMTRAVSGITAQNAGNRVEKKTVLATGLSQEEDALLREKRLVLDKLAGEIKMLTTAVNSIETIEQGGVVNQVNMERKMKYLKAKIQKTAEHAEIYHEFERLNNLSEASKGAQVNVLDIVYPNVKVLIRGQSYIVSEAMRSVMFKCIGGEVQMMGYEREND